MADAELAELVAAVRLLEGTNSANTRAVRELAQIITDPDTGLVKRLDVVARRNTTNRVIIFLLVLGIALAGAIYWRNSDYQDCINGQNDDRSSASVDFWIAEHVKVHNQRVGIDEIRDAAGDRAKATDGFDRFSTATGAYDRFSLQKLRDLGVKVTELPNGDEQIIRPKSTDAAHC